MLIIAAILVAAALPAASLASHAPSKSEKQQLRQAVKGSKLVQRAVRKGKFQFLKPRISDSGRWAKAGIVPTQELQRPFNAPKGLFKHKSSGWKLVKYGTVRNRLPQAAAVALGAQGAQAEVRLSVSVGPSSGNITGLGPTVGPVSRAAEPEPEACHSASADHRRDD